MTIRDVGLAVVRTAPWLERAARWAYAHLPGALHDTPTSRLRDHFAGKSITFIQIGAYDGFAGDPIGSLVLQNTHWRGILVEPQPDAFARLRQNYVNQTSRLQFLNVAVSDNAGEKALFFIPEMERKRLSLPDWAAEVASFDAEHLRKHFPQATLLTSFVRTIAFAEAADRLPGGFVDLIVIDVEGHERAIIDSIDLERHRVKFLIYEHKHLSEVDRFVVESGLRRHGFSIKSFGRDTIAWRCCA